jgi:hypothetical protein
MAHTYSVWFVRQEKEVEVKGGSPRIALPRALHKLGHRNDNLDWVDFQLKKGEELTLRIRRIA